MLERQTYCKLIERNVTTDTNIIINLEHRPGKLSRLGDAWGQAGININGICSVTSDSKGTVSLTSG